MVKKKKTSAEKIWERITPREKKKLNLNKKSFIIGFEKRRSALRKKR